jgi:hypothetical protein
MRIETRSPRGEIIYWLVVSLIPIGLALYFLYDWKIGYYAQNRAEAQKQGYLAGAPEVVDQAMQRSSPTDREFKDLKNSNPTSSEQVRARFGEPLLTRTTDTGLLEERYASRYGVATVLSRNGLIASDSGLTWTDWKHTQSDIQAQLYWTIPCLLFLIWPLRRLMLALTMKASLDDEKLVYRGRVIRYEDMTDLKDYNPKGWVDLYYRRDGEAEPAMLRLDNQKIDAFNEIVETIAARKGFVNPLKQAAAAAQ